LLASDLVSALMGAGVGVLLTALVRLWLFWPVRPLTVGPLRLQGLLPARRAQWTSRLGEMLAETLVDGVDLWAILDTVENREALYRGLRHELHARMEEWPAFPFRRQVAFKIEESVIREVTRYLDRMAKQPEVTRRAVQYLRVVDLVRERLQAIDGEVLDRRVYDAGRRDLGRMSWMGAAGGFVIGALAPMMAFWMTRW
jgi:uncharacterized membrane protein YheB (UPF0754 family)